jgi:deoxyribodipyrimidine photo-lyase
MHPQRSRAIIDGEVHSGPIVYWMSRDQRAHDNWALIRALELAKTHRAPVGVVFCLLPSFLNATLRQYAFVLKGLAEAAATLAEKNIPFFLLRGEPGVELPRFINRHNVAALVTDFSPLRTKRVWTAAVAETINIPFFEVDTHNIVPCWEASPKQEVGARTIRSKLNKRLDEFLDPFPPLRTHAVAWPATIRAIDWRAALDQLPIDRSVPEIDWAAPGEQAARAALRNFIAHRLAGYDSTRNNPTVKGQSDLSPYLHYGNLAPQRLALAIRESDGSDDTKAAFLEEVIVRRELSDNFCFYNPDYDNPNGFPDWAKRSHHQHAADPRPHLYSRADLEHARTHDAAWNAAHRQMVLRGKMHGYMRMYWCKKILEWTRSPAEAMEVAIYLNDRYEIDGRDPNGYTGIAWSIGGVHDRPWGRRPIFGLVRYMSYNGLKNKFNVEAFVEQWGSEPLNQGMPGEG